MIKIAVVKAALGATRGALATMNVGQLRSAKRYPNTAKAVERLTKDAQKVMQRAVSGRFVHWTGGAFKINRITGGLYRSIGQGLRYPYMGHPLRGAVVVDDPKWAWIRDGVKAYDMKPGLLRSPRAKVSSKGFRYVVVPIKVNPENPWSEVVFRVVTSRSQGWIYPGSLPRRLDLYTQEKMRPKVKRLLSAALRADMQGGAR